MNILYLIVWIAGIIPSYFVVKWSMQTPGRIWTKMDRTLAIFMALFSWISIFSSLIMCVIFKQKDLEKPSPW